MDSDIFKSLHFALLYFYVGFAPARKEIKQWLLPGGTG